MRVIAIDPGYERLGIAIIEKAEKGKEILVYSECYTTNRKLSHSARLALISNEITKVIKDYAPDAAAIETLFFSKNQKTAMAVAEARGAILAAAENCGVPIKEFAPAAIKIAVTGHGSSDKKQITAMVVRLIAITKPIQHDDEYDAIAIGLTFFATLKLSTATT